MRLRKKKLRRTIKTEITILSFEEWMDLDIKYIQERSFWVDWKIIFGTFRVCLLGNEK